MRERPIDALRMAGGWHWWKQQAPPAGSLCRFEYAQTGKVFTCRAEDVPEDWRDRVLWRETAIREDGTMSHIFLLARGQRSPARAVIVLAAMPFLLYLQVCRMMSIHYSEAAHRYQDQATELSDRLNDAEDFSDKRECEVQRYFSAADASLDRMGFNAWVMAKDWNRDFLSEQPQCRETAIQKEMR